MNFVKTLQKGHKVLKKEVERIKEEVSFGKYSEEFDNWICDLTVLDVNGQIKKSIKRNRKKILSKNFIVKVSRYKDFYLLRKAMPEDNIEFFLTKEEQILLNEYLYYQEGLVICELAGEPVFICDEWQWRTIKEILSKVERIVFFPGGTIAFIRSPNK